MAYDVKMIDKGRTEELLGRCSSLNYYRVKADINGICIELFSENKDYIDMWTDNFYHMSDSVRSHARIFCNPHQLIRDDRIISLRREFFREYPSQCS